MKWLVQNNIPGNPFKDIIGYFDSVDREITTFSFSMDDFYDNHYLDRFPKDVYQIFCSTKFLEKIDNTHLMPSTLVRFNNQYQVLMEIYNTEYINHNALVKPLCDIDCDTNIFIKPIGDKTFTGEVFNPDTFGRFKKDIEHNLYLDVSLNTHVIMNNIVNITREMRFWIINNKISTYSTYKIGDYVEHIHSVPESVFLYVESLLSLSPYKAYTLDIAEMGSNMYKVLEINCINSSGLYEIDVEKLIFDMENI